jgi:hypothetical protein
MIGKVIRNLLDDSVALTALVPATNMYPYVMNENTVLPAIVYTIDSMEAEYNKDGQVKDAYVFSVNSFSNDYAVLQTIVAAVRAALELKRGTTDGIAYEPIYLRSMQEAYSTGEDVFGNRLTFEVNII